MARQLADLGVDAAARGGDALDLLDDWLAVVVLELDAKFLHALAQLFLEPAADVAFALEHIEHVGAHARGRHGHAVEACRLAVADAGQQIADRIGHHGLRSPVTSSTSRRRAKLPTRLALAAPGARA